MTTASASSSAGGGGRRIAFTTPETYAPRLAGLIELRRWTPLPCPTITVGPTPSTIAALRPYFHRPDPHLRDFSALAFTSRSGISAVAEALSHESPPLPPSGDTFTVAALGKDADLLNKAFLSRICENPSRLRVLIAAVATPASLVRSLDCGSGRRILCPVPLVVDLEEPPVVPDFLDALALKGWDPVRVPAYETRWAGPACAAALAEAVEEVDAVVFTSTAEVEGLLKSLRALGSEWGQMRERRPELVVAAHGPVTAAGAARLGVQVDVVSQAPGSFQGVVDAIDEKLMGKKVTGD